MVKIIRNDANGPLRSVHASSGKGSFHVFLSCFLQLCLKSMPSKEIQAAVWNILFWINAARSKILKRPEQITKSWLGLIHVCWCFWSGVRTLMLCPKSVCVCVFVCVCVWERERESAHARERDTQTDERENMKTTTSKQSTCCLLACIREAAWATCAKSFLSWRTWRCLLQMPWYFSIHLHFCADARRLYYCDTAWHLDIQFALHISFLYTS